MPWCYVLIRFVEAKIVLNAPPGKPKEEGKEYVLNNAKLM